MLGSTKWPRYPDFQSEKYEFDSRTQYKEVKGRSNRHFNRAKPDLTIIPAEG